MAGSGPSVHLVVLETKLEAQAVAAHSPAPYAFIGMFQPRTATQPGADWRAITGGPGLTDDWAGNEPNDGDGTENGAENFSQLYNTGTINDDPGTDVLHYICECDGLPVVATGVPSSS